MIKRMCTVAKPGVLGVVLALGAGVAISQAGGGSTGSATQQPSTGANTPGGMNSPNSMNQPGGMNSNMSGMNSQASMQDKTFLKKATQGSNFEIQTAQLALQKSSSDDVKQFALQMIDDHTKLNEQMKPVASQAGVEPPTGLSKKDEKLYNQLKTMSGNAFDKMYIQTMVADHKEDLKEFKNEASNGQLPDEKSAASQGAQVVDMHLQKAQQLAKTHQISQPSSGLAATSNS